MHNFVHPKVICHVGGLQTQLTLVNVMVVDGGEQFCGVKCLNDPIVVDGFVTSTDLFILPLGVCDVVLGAHWL